MSKDKMPDLPPVSRLKKPIPRSIGSFTVFVLKEIFIQRRWALFPVWVLLALLALLILIGGGSAILPAIYIAL